MSNYNLTQKQSDIISSSSDKILVSASAGTGKTFVMVERIIDILTNKSGDLDNFLIVTFTKASAEEMRGRIRTALKSNLSSTPSLKTQLKKLPTAAISTLHSFCSDLIKRYFYVADMPPKFKVLDDVKASVIKREIMEDLINDLYENGDESFLRLSEIFAAKRKDDGLIDYIIKVFDFSQSLENPEEFINHSKTLKTAEEYLSVFESNFDETLSRYSDVFVSCKQGLNADCLDALSKDCSNFLDLIDVAKKTDGFDNKVAILLKTLSNNRIPSTPAANKTVNQEYYASNRKRFIEEIKKFDSYINMSKDADSLKRISEDIGTFCDIISEFSKRYRREKDRLSYLDFADLEHFALKLLKFPEVLNDIREKYKYVFVDEYQDTSKVQEALIQAISSGNKLFVVGDLKQSIYGFRQCDMSIFAEKENTYGKTTSGEVHYLNTNFRSGGTILKFVNELFSFIMTKEVGIDYASTSLFESLAPDFGEVELDVITIKKEREKAEPIVYSVLEDKNIDTELQTGEIEGKFIASKIKSLVGQPFFDGKANREIRYDDICILSRDISSVKSTSLYKAILSEGIPIVASASGVKLFDYAEVVQAASFIKVLQNYKNDIPLLTVLKSPFFSFSDKELSEIKQTSPKVKFFHESLLYSKNVGNLAEKVNGFFSTIDKYRSVALARGGIYALKKAIYETDFECATLSKFNGEKKMAVVNDFISKISSVCEDGNLAGTVRAIDVLSGNVKADDSLTKEGAVTFMTIHKSKGLEFPIVFLSNLAKQSPNESGTAVFDNTFGIAIKDYDLKTRKRAKTLPYEAITAKKKRIEREEALRVLYVALTRAKSKLFMTGVFKYTDVAPQSIRELYQDKIGDFTTNLEIISKALAKKNTFAKINIVDGEKEKTLPTKFLPNSNVSLPKSEKAISDAIDFRYKYEKDTKLPTKFVASNLKRDYFVEEEVSYKLPDLYHDDKIALGTAYHKLLDLSKPLATKEIIGKALEKMVENGEIDEELSKKLDLSSVEKVLNLPIMSFGKAYTEKPFMMKVPAKLFTDYEQDKEVLLQGIVDLLLINGNDAIVIDYKYTAETNPTVLKSRYERQLSAYAYAVEKALALNVKEKYLLNLRNFELIKI